ncbi:hypothetical protein BDB01DRAFT_799154 [Pilobolus umbonatus]|nr:hypothetical protein BDB01DRAFT_799154 [Pilobolus umbonatus]
MTTLLPLVLVDLHDIEHKDASLIEETVHVAIEHNKSMLISIECDEIRRHEHTMDVIWDKIQAFLGTLYVIQTSTCYREGKPLLNCDILFQDICGYSIPMETSIDSVCCLDKDISRWKGWNEERKKRGLAPLKRYAVTGNNQTRYNPIMERKGPVQPHAFKRVAVGGTFDQLHAGHKILLTMTALLTQSSMVVGVTDDCMLLKKKHKNLISCTATRVEGVKKYLNRVRRNIKHDVVPIEDPFGPTATDPTIDALVVSKETFKGGEAVNRERYLRGFALLELRIIDVISSDHSVLTPENFDLAKISSSWIRDYIAKNKQL